MLGIFLDTETNGLNPFKHRIAEVAFKIVDLLTLEVKTEYQTLVQMQPHEWEKSDPESLKLNNFTWSEVSHGKPPLKVAEEIIFAFGGQDIRRGHAVFICQNPSFDRVFFSQLIDTDKQEKLLWPYHWLDLASMYWVRAIDSGKLNKQNYPWETGISKDKIAAHYNLPTEKKPHRAMNGVDHLFLCYKRVISK
jgi:oligoribonuclease